MRSVGGDLRQGQATDSLHVDRLACTMTAEHDCYVHMTACWSVVNESVSIPRAHR